MLSELPSARDAHARYAEGFAHALRQVPEELVSSQLRCGGAAMELRSVGVDLHRLIRRPFRVAGSPHQGDSWRPRLRIDVWDGQLWGDDPGLSRAGDEPGVRYGAGGEEVAYSECRRYLRYTGPGFTFWLDRHESRIVGRCASPSGLPAWNRSRPLQPLIGAWLLDRGAVTVHAAMVAADRRGALLAGSTGSGKSTCAMAALEGGLDLLGDDLVAVTPSGSSMQASCVYTTVKLTRDAVRVRPELSQLAEPHEAGEWLLYAAELEPDPTVTSSDLTAIAFPELAAERSSRIVPLNPGRALLELLSCLQPMEPGHVGQSFALARRLVAQLPAFRLEVGRSPGELGRTLRELCGGDH